ncbi:TNF receptor-associated factor 6-like [Paramuricea clavata]|uniref:TNF receptor-associated factor 6-like n=2 Tax=Paramuricea clavata TaxID=317549 RepID=A0A6S7FZK8_PARCT|nr:TNF receptor-associated factor 6-like [Paramuricea clavata]
MLREKLTAGHEKECPKAQAVCEFKAYGCKWTGVRLQLQNHLKNEVSMATHLSLLCKATTVLLPTNGRDKNKDGASKSEASGSGSSGNAAVSGNVLEELNRQRNRNAESIATVEAKIEQVERKTRDLTGRVDRQQRENEGSMTLLKNTVIELEARMCNGVYLWRITGYARHLENARDNVVTALHSPPFYTNFYGYKLCLRINPNGVDTGYGSHVSLFVHMMQSDWDDTLEWPFSGRISLSILDQSDDGEYKRHISETLVTRPNLLAFQRPTTPRNHKGYGYVEFAHIETLQDRQYLKNDCLLVRVQVFQ